MLLGNKEKAIKLHAENFLWGNLTFDYGESEDERLALAEASLNLGRDLNQWLRDNEKNPQPEEHKKTTEALYYQILGWHVRGRIKGVLRDVDLDLENDKLKDEVMRLKIQLDECKKDNIKALTELRDKNSLIEQYEQSQGIKRP